MTSDGMLFIISSIVLLIAVAFVAISQYLSKYRERLTSSSVSFSPTEALEADTDNSRQNDRINIHWPVILEINGEKTEAETTNICISGAFIKHSSPLKVGERFSITLDIPDHQEITLEGEVIWNNSGLSEDKVVRRGMGIRFLGISSESREILTQVLISSHAAKQAS